MNSQIRRPLKIFLLFLCIWGECIFELSTVVSSEKFTNIHVNFPSISAVFSFIRSARQATCTKEWLNETLIWLATHWAIERSISESNRHFRSCSRDVQKSILFVQLIATWSVAQNHTFFHRRVVLKCSRNKLCERCGNWTSDISSFMTIFQMSKWRRSHH